ncbi:MAG TPA: deoxyribose-phosphate aldolase [Acidimicrobiia bacterium]|nr:deoxyribose-phosphate aldolase [Acidimicrobiia bacterium]
MERAAAARSRTAHTGRMVLIAADHPARGALAARGRPHAMANRQDLLERLVTALERPGVDGVLGTPDIVEDLLLLGALEDKIVMGSMNRGGLAGSVFELDDRYTAYDAGSLAEMGLDGGKMLIRIALEDPGTVRTLEHTARAVSELAASGLMALVEPFMSKWDDGKLVNDLSADAVIKSVGIASALGSTSGHTWLKLPVVDEMERVMESTTMPTLLLGGDPQGPDEEVFASWEKALGLPGVRGLVVGRALLYPQNDDVAAAVDVAAGLVART